jgi:hypothetical protein
MITAEDGDKQQTTDNRPQTAKRRRQKSEVWDLRFGIWNFL